MILGSDRHDAPLLNYGFERVCAWLEEDGFPGAYELGAEKEALFGFCGFEARPQKLFNIIFYTYKKILITFR